MGLLDELVCLIGYFKSRLFVRINDMNKALSEYNLRKRIECILDQFDAGEARAATSQVVELLDLTETAPPTIVVSDELKDFLTETMIFFHSGDLRQEGRQEGFANTRELRSELKKIVISP